MNRLILLLPPLLFIGLAVLFYTGMQRDDPDGLPSAMQGRAAPAVQVTPLGGGAPFTDAVLREGGVKLVNYWASWCAPCRAEHPLLEQLAAEGVPIYGVNYKDDPAKALAFLAELGNPFAAMGADSTGHMALNWGLYGVPETFVLAADGTVILRYAGPITARSLEDTIRPALAEAASN
jgi:cytochrome c biogenesis protein CcmG/thiol:disulfide interchange protein DsbE